MTDSNRAPVLTTRLRDLPEALVAWRSNRWFGFGATLWDHDRPLATFRVTGGFARRARLTTADGVWDLASHGFFLGRKTARAAPPRTATLDFIPGVFRGGRLRLTNGDELEWRLVSLWRGIWAFRRGADECIRFARGRMLPRATIEVSWARDASDLPELDGLVGLGWWLLRVHHRHSH